MFRFEWLFLIQMIMGGLLILLLIKVMQMKKQVDDVVKEILSYISFVTEEPQEEMQEKLESEPSMISRKKKENQDELQNKLIQSVLGEYFL